MSALDAPGVAMGFYCHACTGNGVVAVECEVCDGAGNPDCHACAGQGEYWSICHACTGTGLTEEYR